MAPVRSSPATPLQVRRRYAEGNQDSDLAVWRFNNAATALPVGKRLRVEVLAPARLRWSADEWKTQADVDTRPTRFGVHVADLPTAALEVGASIVFTFYWLEAKRWEGRDFRLAVVEPDSACPADVHLRHLLANEGEERSLAAE